MVEKRRHPRLTIMGMVRIELPGEGKTQEGYLASVSPGGIGVYLHREVKPGENVEILVRMDNGKGQETEQRIRANVIWSKKAGDLYMIGLRFERMSREKYEAALKSLFVLERLE